MAGLLLLGADFVRVSQVQLTWALCRSSNQTAAGEETAEVGAPGRGVARARPPGTCLQRGGVPRPRRRALPAFPSFLEDGTCREEAGQG